MSWSWSHSVEAYQAAENNMRDLPLEKLVIILAEWKAAEPDEDGDTGFDQEKYTDAIHSIQSELEAGTLYKDMIEDDIWKRMSEQATCTNGGHEAHCCPFGCGCHLVGFD